MPSAKRRKAFQCPQDFATGKRNNLEFINILNDDGTLNGNCGVYAGKPRYEVTSGLACAIFHTARLHHMSYDHISSG